MDKYGILCVGLVCVDIINEVEKYPAEDTDQRCLSQWWQRGGNASNNCTVLSILGAEPHFLGTIADTNQRIFIENDFLEFGVDISSASIVRESETPISCVIVSSATGSRTIVHSNKNLREVTFEEFSSIDLSHFSWIHFEGRNVSATKEMMKHICLINAKRGKKLTVSVEIEKKKSDLQELIPLADIIFVSKDHSLFMGCTNINDALEEVSKMAQERAIVICAWGDQGAGVKIGRNGPIHLSSAFSPAQVRDTLGAGDTFIASTIFALSAGESAPKSIEFGCRVAGFKIGLRGWNELKEFLPKQDFILDVVSKFRRIRSALL